MNKHPPFLFTNIFKANVPRNQQHGILSSAFWSHGREAFRRCWDKRVYLQTSTWLQFKEAVSQCLFTVEIWPKFCQESDALKFEIRLGNFYSSF